MKIRNIDFQIRDSYNLAFPDKSFDIVIASNVFHLLYEPEKPLKEIGRVMKDNGIFIAPTTKYPQAGFQRFTDKKLINLKEIHT